MNKFKSTLPDDASPQVSTFWPICFSRRFLKIFFYIYLCKYLTKTHPFRCGPNLSPDIIIWIKLNRLYLRIISHKFHLFWPNDFSEEFWKIPIHFQWFNIISPFKKVWSFFGTNLYPLHPVMLSFKFDLNWSSGFEDAKMTTPTIDNGQNHKSSHESPIRVGFNINILIFDWIFYEFPYDRKYLKCLN